MKKHAKKEVMWAIRYNERFHEGKKGKYSVQAPFLHVDTIRTTRAEAIRAWITQMGRFRQWSTWNELKVDYDVTAVKVMVKEIGEGEA
jgi:hypothetical protein